MKSNIEAAHQAMLEGSRDEVLRLLEQSPATNEVLWLRAHASTTQESREQLLQDVSGKHDDIFNPLAEQILDREADFARQLAEPPDYKFWKQPTWDGKLRKMKPFRLWLAGGILLLLFTLIGISYNTKSQTQEAETIASIKATQTAVAFSNQIIATYGAGRLQVLQIDYPTNRPVTFGETNNDAFVPVVPASGASFAAVKLQFFCMVALCANPPEAELQLLMTDGHVINYEGGARPFLIDQAPMQRIAQGETTESWFVFEVPNNIQPDAILVVTGDSETPQRIKWKNP